MKNWLGVGFLLSGSLSGYSTENTRLNHSQNEWTAFNTKRSASILGIVKDKYQKNIYFEKVNTTWNELIQEKLTTIPKSPFADDFRVVDQTNSIRLLQIRPNMVLGISPLNSGELLVQTNIDAQYWYKESFDARLSLMGGTINGVRFGGTYHLSDTRKEKTQKFIVSESESNGVRTTEYYRKPAKIRKVKGLTGDVLISFYNVGEDAPKGFFTEIRGGLDFQYFSRNYLDVGSNTYPSNKNGWFSLKFMGVLQYYSLASANSFGIGAVSSLNAVRRPWKGVSMNLNLDLGLIAGTGGITPVISPGFGLSINLVNSKESIDY